MSTPHPALLIECQRLVLDLEDDIRWRLKDEPGLDNLLREDYRAAMKNMARRPTYGTWRDEYLTQVAVHWVLAAVFVRFLEDNELLPEPWLSGPGPRRALAQDRHERFFAEQPAASDREMLLACFREVERLPAMAPLFNERHNPIFRLGPSADGAREIVNLFRKVDAGTGTPVHDFVDPEWNTRFLGDLYQDLSESARKRFALLQTPEFVEEFILDRTLDRAMEEIGYPKVKLIDPACGSGHFLLGAFRRIFARWLRNEPGTNSPELARRTLEQIAGVDVNPFAVAIARFRLLIAALQVSEITRLSDAPAFPLNLAAGDSLLHGPRPGEIAGRTSYLFGEDPLGHVYDIEDKEELRRLLGQRYDVVVGNPPYITPKDAALNKEYRRFGSCHGKYSLAVPFTERFFDLAAPGEPGRPAGFVGMITANSFMKREFGKKLIEEYIPKWDLTHVIDTAGAYIPGHGTPTVIMLGRNRRPVSNTIRAVMGIRGEPNTPENPSLGLVWTAILHQVDYPGSQSAFVSSADLPRERFAHHPWSLGGGGASDLKELVEENSPSTLHEAVESIGFGAILGEDEVFGAPPDCPRMNQISDKWLRPLVEGELVRDWAANSQVTVAFPYDANIELVSDSHFRDWFWPMRTVLASRLDFSKKTYREAGRPYWEYHQIPKERNRTPLFIAFGEVATHNHFVLDRGGKVFNRTAPIIKLPNGATEDAHLAILGCLNSSVACFWLRQVCFPKGGDHVGSQGARVRKTFWDERFAFNGSNLQAMPIPGKLPLSLAQLLDSFARERAGKMPSKLLLVTPALFSFGEARSMVESIARQMIALQEELDWQVYRLYGLLTDPLEMDPAEIPEVALGERPFEIALARKVAAGEIETKWFERHGSTPVTEIPGHWPEPYRRMIEKRLQAIADNPWIALIEQPEYKRRWNREPWEDQEQRALRSWLLDHLEDRRYWPEPRITSTARLADHLRKDDEFRQIAVLYRGRDDFDWTELISELALDEAVPYLAAYRYTDAGLRKRAEWEETWRLQRLEDAIDARTKQLDAAKAIKAREVGTIPVPPRYAAADFRKSTYWRLRGKLDVPKERFIHYPGLEKDGDASPVIGWAGWNHLEQAQAVGTAFHELREREAWGADHLEPLLAGLLELLPWLQQWHNEPDPDHGGLRLGDYFAGFLDEEARGLGLTRESLAVWQPAVKKGRKAGRAARTASRTTAEIPIEPLRRSR